MTPTGDDRTYDGLDAIFLRVAPPDIAMIKFLFESYEEVAIVRTLDRHQAIIVALVSHDYLDVARGILDSLQSSLAIEEIPPPGDSGEDWLMRFLQNPWPD